MRFEEMNKKPTRRSRKMPSGQGFYLVLLICLGIIGEVIHQAVFDDLIAGSFFLDQIGRASCRERV